MARPRHEHPTPGELEILQVLWERGSGTVRDVHGALQMQKPRAYTTVMSLMNTMADKRLLVREPRGKAFVYSATSRREQTLSDLVADLYLEAIDFLDGVGVPQYEISNFAGPGSESRHNLKYWTRQPYLGFGLDAHSMLYASNTSTKLECIRLANTDDLAAFSAGSSKPEPTLVDDQQASEEIMFLGLRLNRGIDVEGEPVVQHFKQQIGELCNAGLLEQCGTFLRLTPQGRLLSNEVFERFIAVPAG